MVDSNKKLSGDHVIKREVDILQKLSAENHPNIVDLVRTWEFGDRLFLVLDYVPGGDLFDLITKYRRFTEREAMSCFEKIDHKNFLKNSDFLKKFVSHILVDIMRAVRFLHENNICHRDIKPENCLLLFPPLNDDDVLSLTVKLTDFGLATEVKDEPLTMICGSPTYVAPEIVSQDGLGYSLPVDMWAIGVMNSFGPSDSLNFQKILTLDQSFFQRLHFTNRHTSVRCC